MKETEQMNWIPFDEAVEIVKNIDRLDWFGNFKMKYLSIRIDTRDFKCLLLDRDNRVLTQLEYEDYKNGKQFSYKKWRDNQ